MTLARPPMIPLGTGLWRCACHPIMAAGALWDQFAALLPPHPVYAPSHPLGCHRRRIADRIIFQKLIQVLRFGCSYEAIADCTCPAAIRERRDEWIEVGLFAWLKQITLDGYDGIVGLVLEEIAVDGCITKAPGAGSAPTAARLTVSSWA